MFLIPNQEMIMRGPVLATFVIATLIGSAANAQPQQTPAGSSCFFISQFQNWKAPDAKTIFLRINVDQFYRLDLTRECPSLLWPDAHLIMNVRGPDEICSAVDWDLKVNNTVHSIPEPCIVKKMTLLTPAQAQAIPPKFKP
jgi:Family of unknown function (DUF6491)